MGKGTSTRRRYKVQTHPRCWLGTTWGSRRLSFGACSTGCLWCTVGRRGREGDSAVSIQTKYTERVTWWLTSGKMESDRRGRVTTIRHMTQPEMASMYNRITWNTKYRWDTNYGDQNASIEGDGRGEEGHSITPSTVRWQTMSRTENQEAAAQPCGLTTGTGGQWPKHQLQVSRGCASGEQETKSGGRGRALQDFIANPVELWRFFKTHT